MSALIRYTIATLMHTQRWVAPLLILSLAGSLTWVPPFTLDNASLTLIALFPVAAWLAYATGTVETASQERVTVTHAGSATRVQIAKTITPILLVATLPCANILIAGAVAGWRPSDTVFAVIAVLVTGVIGCAFGSLLARLAPSAPGWALLLIVLAAMLETIVPHVPPVRAYVALFQSPGIETAAFAWMTIVSLSIAGGLLALTSLFRRT